MASRYQPLVLLLACSYYGESLRYGALSRTLDLRTTLSTQYGLEPQQIKIIFNTHLTQKALQKAFRQLAREAQAVAVAGLVPAVVIAFDGHLLPEGAWLPYDFQEQGSYQPEWKLFPSTTEFLRLSPTATLGPEAEEWLQQRYRVRPALTHKSLRRLVWRYRLLHH